MKIKYFLLAIVVAGALVRLYGIGDRPLWTDEEQSVLEANGMGNQLPVTAQQIFTNSDFRSERKISNIASAVVERDSGNGILYVLGLSGWTAVTGSSTLGVRLFSWLFSVMTIFVVYSLAKELTGSEQAGNWSALLFSFQHLSILYAQEARGYAMATFFIALSTLCFFRICKRQSNLQWTTMLLYGLSSGIALLSHYFTFYILLGQIIIAILFYRNSFTWRNLMMGGAMAGLMLLIWMLCGGMAGLEMMQWRNAKYQEQSVLDPGNIFYGAATAKTILAGVFQMVTHLFSIGFQNAGLRIRETIPFLIFPIVLLYLNRDYLKKERSLLTMLGIFIFSAPILAVVLALISGHTISFQTLYASFSVPFCCVLTGILFDNTYKEVSYPGKIFLMCYGTMVLLSAILNLTATRH